jgi:hypothetical protein
MGGLRFDVKVDGSQEAVRNLDRVKDATTRVATSNTQSAAAARTQSEAARQQAQALGGLSGNWGQVASAMGQASGVLGRISPQFGAFGQLLGQVGGAATALTGAMGPVGIAMGLVTTAVGLASIAFDHVNTEMEQNAEAAENAERSVRDLAQAYREVNAQQNQMAGTAAAADISASIEETTQAISVLQRELSGAMAPFRAHERTQAGRGGLGWSAAEIVQSAAQGRSGGAFSGLREEAQEVLRLQRQIADLEQQGAQLREGLDLAGASSGRTGRVVGPGMPGFLPTDEQREAAAEAEREQAEHEDRRTAIARRGHDERSALERQLARYAEITERQLASVEADIAEGAARAHEAASNARVERERFAAMQINAYRNAIDDLDREHTEAQIERANELARARTRAHEQTHENAMRLAEAQADRSRALQRTAIDSSMAAMDSLHGFLGDVLGSIRDGNELTGQSFLRMLDAFLEATAIEYTIKALAEGGNAIAAAARYDYAAAAQHGVSAGIYAAVAGLTGIAGGAISVPSAGAGSSASAAPAGSAASSGGGGTVIHNTVNLFSPNAVFTEAERGQLISRSQRQQQREFGMAA